jgi:hypothetical protein
MRSATVVAVVLCLASARLCAGGATHYGDPVPVDVEAVSLAAALAESERYAQSPHAIRGEITSVCQDKGCWTIIRDGSAWARVSTGHRYFLPKDASGIAVAYGRLELKQIDARTVAHLAAEGGEAQEQEFRIDAIAIAIEPAAEGTP